MGSDLFIQGNPAIEQLIATTLQIEAQPRFAIEDKKALYQARQTMLSELDSKLSTLNSLSERLTSALTDYFAAKAVSSSDSDIFTATAESDALAGSHDISIARLASADTRVSKQYTTTGTDLVTFFSTNGSQTFYLEVAHPTTDDDDNRETITVTIDPSGTTDDEIMNEIALAINNAMSSATTAETIDADEKLTASVVHEESGVSRLIFKSGQSGYTYRMVQTDSTNSLLAELEINSSSQTASTSGGYITLVGTSDSTSELSSELEIDGLTFYRDSNTINDILDDVTINVKDVTSTTESMQVSIDTNAVKEEIQALLDSYNEVITYLRDKSRIDPETNIRGPLAGDSTYSYLRYNLRNIFTGSVSDVASGNAEHLFEVGITAANDGTLSFTDDEEFETALAAGSSNISDLFSSTDGIATQVEEFLEAYVKVGGVLDDSKSSIEDRIESLDDRIERFDARLARREVQLRKQLAQMQQVSVLLGGQAAAFSSLASSFGF